MKDQIKTSIGLLTGMWALVVGLKAIGALTWGWLAVIFWPVWFPIWLCILLMAGLFSGVVAIICALVALVASLIIFLTPLSVLVVAAILLDL